jgi:coenzyme F420-reducing hydrogenase delta subunit
MNSRKPNVACFVCNWAVDEEELAAAKLKISSNTSIVSVACIGGIDPVVPLEILLKGIDGVLMVGCAPPDCHFVKGNVCAEHAVNVLKKLIALSLLEPERLALRWISPLDKTRFSEILEDFTGKLETIGASPLSKEKYEVNIFENLSAAKNVLEDYPMRAAIGKELELGSGVNAYDEKIPQEELNALLDKVLETEFVRHRILLSGMRKSFSVKELAATLNMKPASVLRHILNMRRKGMIAVDHYEGNTPLYKALEVR